MNDWLFVYGTLQQHWLADESKWPAAADKQALRQLRRALQQQARWHGSAQIRGRLYRVAHYPGLICDPRGDWINGDLYALRQPQSLLPLLDAYEECSPAFPPPHEYQRVRCQVQVMTDNGQRTQTRRAWVYRYNRSVAGLEPLAGY